MGEVYLILSSPVRVIDGANRLGITPDVTGNFDLSPGVHEVEEVPNPGILSLGSGAWFVLVGTKIGLPVVMWEGLRARGLLQLEYEAGGPAVVESKTLYRGVAVLSPEEVIAFQRSQDHEFVDQMVATLNARLRGWTGGELTYYSSVSKMLLPWVAEALREAFESKGWIVTLRRDIQGGVILKLLPSSGHESWDVHQLGKMAKIGSAQ